MARDRKRAKQRQRRAAARPAPAARRERDSVAPGITPATPDVRPPEELPDDGAPEGREIADLEHASAEVDIARAAERAGAADPGSVRESLDQEVGGPQEDEPPDTGQEAAAERALGRRQAQSERGLAVVTFLRNCWAELRRVQWPDRRQVAQGTAVVIAFVVLTGLFLGGMDFISQKLMDLIL